jgi:hypothetical protein
MICAAFVMSADKDGVYTVKIMTKPALVPIHRLTDDWLLSNQSHQTHLTTELYTTLRTIQNQYIQIQFKANLLFF